MVKFIFRTLFPASRSASFLPAAYDDPFADAQIANMDLEALADLPPEELRDRKRTVGNVAHANRVHEPLATVR